MCVWDCGTARAPIKIACGVFLDPLHPKYLTSRRSAFPVIVLLSCPSIDLGRLSILLVEAQRPSSQGSGLTVPILRPSIFCVY